MEWWAAVILGLVEGITEYLPISSTGHLILTSSLLGLHTPEMKPAVSAFEIVVQGGAILAVLGLYWPRVLQMLRGVIGKDPVGLDLALKLFIAFLPAAVFGFLLDDWIEHYLFHAWPVLAALFFGGIFMMVIDLRRTGRLAAPMEKGAETEITNLSARQALFIGLLQCVAMWPGTSRSMMTISGGILVGMKPRAAAEFSFLLGLPTLGAATLYKLFKNVRSDDNMFELLGVTPVVIGVVVAAVSAAFAVKWLVGFLNRHGLMAFGWYRIALTAVLLGLMLAGIVDLEPVPGDEPVPDLASP